MKRTNNDTEFMLWALLAFGMLTMLNLALWVLIGGWSQLITLLASAICTVYAYVVLWLSTHED